MEDIKMAGAQKKVEPLKDNPNVVRATFRAPHYEQAYGTYLLGKLSNILFPGVLPKALAFGQRDSGEYYMDLERLPLDAMHLNMQAERNRSEMSKKALAKLAAEHNAHEITYYKHVRGEQFEARMDISASFRDAGLPFDSYPFNWTFAEGRLRNVDMKAPWIDPDNRKGRHFDPEKIRAKIATLNSAEEQRQAAVLLEELLALEK